MRCVRFDSLVSGFYSVSAFAIASILALIGGCAHDRGDPVPSRDTEEKAVSRPAANQQPPSRPRPALAALIPQKYLIKPQPPKCANEPVLAGSNPATTEGTTELNRKSLEILVLGLERDCYSRAEENGRIRLIKLQDAVKKAK
jgi:hypothetical protein